MSVHLDPKEFRKFVEAEVANAIKAIDDKYDRKFQITRDIEINTKEDILVLVLDDIAAESTLV